MFHLNVVLLRRTKEKVRAEKEERAEEEGHEESQGRCCIRQDKGRKAACEDQKNDQAGRQARAQDGVEVGTQDCNARKER
jgi:hypothetical protein